MANTDIILLNVGTHQAHNNKLATINTDIANIKAKLVVNTKDKDGFVSKGNGQKSKVWQTDDNGNPAWRDIPSCTHVGNSAPSTNSQYLTWIDTSQSPALLKYRTSKTSTSWILVGSVWS